MPQTGKREDRNRVPRSIVAFMNAALLTGDDRYMDVWRRQNAAINAQRERDRRQTADAAHVRPEGLVQLCAGPVSIERLRDLVPVDEAAKIARSPANIPGSTISRAATPTIQSTALRASLERVRTRVAQVHADKSTPETRLADNALEFNPASVASLLQLTQGALHIARPPWSPTSPPRVARLCTRGCATSIRFAAGLDCRKTWRRWSIRSKPDAPASRW